MPRVTGRSPVVPRGTTTPPTNPSAARAAPRVVVDAKAGGAWFYKVLTAANVKTQGLRMVGVLPKVAFDPNRLTVVGVPSAWVTGARPSATPREFYQRLLTAGAGAPTQLLDGLSNPRSGPLDRPSVYSGGEAAHQHVDAGLSTDRVYDPRGRPTFTSAESMSGGNAGQPGVFALGGVAPERVLLDGQGQAVATGDAAVVAALKERGLVPNYGFRPFWRVSPGGGWSNPSPIDAKNPSGAGNLSFFGGDAISMTLAVAAPGQTMMTIASGATRGQYRFETPAFGAGAPMAWKRVQSIDQFLEVPGSTLGRKGNETDYSTRPPKVAHVVPTQARALGASWSETSVLLDDGSRRALDQLTTPPSLVRGNEFPLTAAGNAAWAKAFRITTVNGLQTVDLTP